MRSYLILFVYFCFPVIAALAERNLDLWSGLYWGIRGGYGITFGEGDHHCIDNFGVPDGGILCQQLPAGSDAIDTQDGGIIGVHIGVNQLLSENTLIGLEADIGLSNIGGESSVDGPFPFNGGGVATPAGYFKTDHTINWLSTLRGRIGNLISPRTLIYGTGGLAFGQVDASSIFTTPNVASLGVAKYEGSVSKTKFGFVAGLGIERALGNGWKVGLESLYFDLGTIRTFAPESPIVFGPLGYRHDASIDIAGLLIRAGISRNF